MPVAVSYPGVYVEEIPSGVRTITGVATSIAAFIGRTLRGPTDEPVFINSYADFERTFGGLWTGSTLGYAVRDFYLNGGSQAIIVRLYHPSFDSPADLAAAMAAATATAAVAVGATPAAAYQAAAIKAAAYKTDIEKNAAMSVAAAAQRAALAGPTVADVKRAADGAAAAVASPPDATAAALATATAAAGADAISAANAAKAKAATYTADPAKTAADSVAVAAQGALAAGVTLADVTNAVNAAVADTGPTTRARLQIDGLNLIARDEGSWGNSLRARIDYDVAGGAANLFNLTVRDGTTGRIEMFRNVSGDADHVRRVDKVLDRDSTMVSAVGTFPILRPSAHADLAIGETDVWADTNANPTNAKVATADVAVDGGWLDSNDFIGAGKADKKHGLYALEDADLFNMLCIPPYLVTGDVDNLLLSTAGTYCESRRAMLIVDPPTAWNTKGKAKTAAQTSTIPTSSKNAAIFFPRLRQPDPKRGNVIDDFAPCGAIAGVFARTDTTRGVWKAPAGLDATLVGVPDLSVKLTDGENGELNPLGINCLRTMPAAGRIVWGSRTLQGDDRLASEWKYIPVRRTALYIEESLYRGTQWVVFEPNDEPLWAQIRLNVGAFMHTLFRKGAFQGTTPKDAYFVKCDKETTTQNDINLGVVNIAVGFAPLKPAEFVIIQLQQMAGQIES